MFDGVSIFPFWYLVMFASFYFGTPFSFQIELFCSIVGIDIQLTGDRRQTKEFRF